jgi:hypothetical protein
MVGNLLVWSDPAVKDRVKEMNKGDGLVAG